MDFVTKFRGKVSYRGHELILTEEDAQILLENILEKFHLDIAEILRDGEKVDYMSTEGEHLEITVRTKEKPNAIQTT